LSSHLSVTYIAIVTRDRSATRARILAAAEQLAAKEGIGAVRINALAAAAGVDKVLIYRYFGGRAQLLRALARERRIWPDVPESAAPESLAADLTAMLLSAARELRASPLSRRAVAWELMDAGEFARETAAARDEHAATIAATLRERYRLPPFVDLDALVAFLTGAMIHLALQSGARSTFASLDLRRDQDWRRVERVLAGAVHALLGPVDQ
jgi:AcrR family transcriptional regulator